MGPTTQTFDDGTVVNYDASGNVVSFTSPGDTVPTAPDSSIWSSFTSTLSAGLNLKLEQALGLVPTPSSAPAATSSLAASSFTSLLVWGGIAAAVYFVLRKRA